MLVEKKLKSGKVVVVKELTALEEVLGYQFVNSKADEAETLGAAVLHTYTLVALSLVSLNGDEVVKPADINGVYAILNMFSNREWKEVLAAFNEANRDEDLTGE